MNKVIVEKLEEFRQKGGAWQSQRKAEKYLLELKEMLLESEYMELQIAHTHYQLNEGATELYHVCGLLISKYRADIEPPTFEKTFA